MTYCFLPYDTLREYRPHTVFIDQKPGVINCSGDTCKICRVSTAAVTWKEIDRLVKEMFGRRKE